MIETMDAVMFARLDAGIAAGFHESVHGVERVGGWMFSLLPNQSNSAVQRGCPQMRFPEHPIPRKALGRLAEGIYRLRGYAELNHAAVCACLG